MNSGANSKVPLRLDYIDGLRALAAIYVTLHHMLWYVNDQLPQGIIRHVLSVFTYGHYAVDLFIVLSGFCLMLPVIRNNGHLSGGTSTFLWKRARRILPPYYAALGASLLLIWLWIGNPTETIFNGCIPVNIADVLSHLLLVQDAFLVTSHKINYSLWTISVEWRIYFVFPALVWSWRRFGALWTTAGALLVSFLLLFPLEYSPFDKSAGGVCLHYYGLFALGMLAAGIAYSEDRQLQKLRDRIPWTASFMLLFGLTIFLTKAGSWHGREVPWQCRDLLMGLAAISLLTAAAGSQTKENFSRIGAILSWRPLVMIGTFSYSLYLLHAPLLELIWAYSVRPLHLSGLNAFLLLSTVGLAAITGIAYLFFFVFERPFIGKRKRHPVPIALAGEAPLDGSAAILTITAK